MRLTAPELAARYRAGMVAEGVHVLDAGQVGSEMVYFLVGSRELDGGLMCTASHNPKAYTGREADARGGARAVGRRGHPGHPPRGRSARRTAPVRRARPRAAGDGVGAGHGRAGRPVRGVPAGGAGLHRPRRGQAGQAAEGGRGRRQRHGRADGRAAAGRASGSTWWRPTGPRTGTSPTTNRTRCSRRTGASSSSRCASREPTSGSPGTATPTAASSSTTRASSCPATSSPRCSPSRCCAAHPGEAILYDVRASWAVPDTVTRAGGQAFINRVGHAFFKTRMRKEGSLFGGEVSGHYYFRDFYCADSGTLPALLMLELLAREGAPLSSLLEPYRSRYFISGEINSRGRGPGRQDRARSRSATATPARAASTASRSTTRTGTSTCAPRTPSRCCACAWSRWSRPRTWSAAATRCSP